MRKRSAVLVIAMLLATGYAQGGAMGAEKNVSHPQLKPLESGHAPVNGIDLYYAVYGEGEPLVLLHGGFGMIEMFGQDQFEHLTLNTPYRLLSGQDVNMPGMGTFHNRDVQLTWIGRSHRNGQDCAVIEYHAFFNPLEIANGGMTLTGRSHYWGEIWVSLSSKQIEYATLQEDVLGEMTLAGEGAPRTVSIFRSGIFAPLK